MPVRLLPLIYILLIFFGPVSILAQQKPRVSPSYSKIAEDLSLLCREVARDGWGDQLLKVSSVIGKQERRCLACRAFARAVEKSCSKHSKLFSSVKRADVSTEAISIALGISSQMAAKEELNGRLVLSFLKIALDREVRSYPSGREYFNKLFYFLLSSLPEDGGNSTVNQSNLNDLF